jgi:hypothetical protein
MKTEKNGFACSIQVHRIGPGASAVARECGPRLCRVQAPPGSGHAGQAEPRQDGASREERQPDTMQAPMLGSLIYEAVMERNSTRVLNDALRQTFTGGPIIVSPGVLALPPQANAEVLERVRRFTAFDADDPYHDFGRFDLAGVTYVFEVDCCARDMSDSKDPADPGKATRMLTIMRADEY